MRRVIMMALGLGLTESDVTGILSAGAASPSRGGRPATRDAGSRVPGWQARAVTPVTRREARGVSAVARM